MNVTNAHTCTLYFLIKKNRKRNKNRDREGEREAAGMIDVFHR